MRIVIDLQSCQSGSRLGGIGRYSVELAKAMARQARNHELWLVMNTLIAPPVEDVRSIFSDLIPQNQIKTFSVPNGISELRNNKSKVRVAELIREHFISMLKPDIVHISSLFEGLQEEVVTSVGALFRGDRTAVTLYDLIPLVQSEKYLSNIEALEHYRGKVDNLKRAGLQLSISEYSRIEAIDLLGLNPSNVINISSAADERFRPIALDAVEIERLRKKYGIKRDFLMYTGSFDQRKNHANLIQAFGMVPKSIRQNHQLLIVGNGWDAIYRQLRLVAKKAGLEENEIVFSGHVSDDDLLPLYNLCDLFVFPSLAEGFGLPALEAMSCGTATIGSNCTSLPEVIGLEDALFDPKKPSSIAKTITRVLADNNFKEKLRNHGIKQAKKFSWDESARKAIVGFEEQFDRSKRKPFIGASVDLLDDLLGKMAEVHGVAGLPNEALEEVSRCVGLNMSSISTHTAISKGEFSTLRLGWVSSWNTRCGIAAYSKFLIEQINSKVTIFAPLTEWTTDVDQENVIRCWQSGVPDDLSNLLEKIDASNIEVLVLQFNYSFFDFEALDLLLQKLQKAAVRIFVTFHSTYDPSDTKLLSNLRDSLAQCEGLFVHSIQDLQRLRALNLSHNARFLPQGVIATTPKAPSNFCRPTNATVVATYGFALPHKGLLEMVEAVNMLTAQGGAQFHLLMINAEYPDPQSWTLLAEIKKLIAKYKLEDRVTLVTDYLTNEESLGFLQASDLVVYAYQGTGESSSAAVRMGLASRTPVLVSPIPIFHDVGNAVFHLPGKSPQLIANGIVDTLRIIKSSNQKSLDTLAQADLWRTAHLFKTVSAQMLEYAVKPVSTPIIYQLPREFLLKPNSNIIKYQAAAVPLKTSIGRASPDAFHTTSQKGHLLFGPFITAAEGSYKAVVRGDISVGSSGLATADVSIEGGKYIIAHREISQCEEGVLAILNFVIPDGGCSDLEVRVEVDENFKCSIYSVEFHTT
jgi:glycosyltransferase involved in cell wall biosynthesis